MSATSLTRRIELPTTSMTCGSLDRDLQDRPWSQLMTGTPISSTAEQAPGKVASGGGHGGPPNVVDGRTGSKGRDPLPAKGDSGCAQAPTRPVPLRPAASSRHTAGDGLPLEPWPPDDAALAIAGRRAGQR